MRKLGAWERFRVWLASHILGKHLWGEFMNWMKEAR